MAKHKKPETQTPDVQTILGRKLQRTTVLQRADLNIDEEKRTVELAFASDQPIEHWFGKLILDHSEGAIRFERLRTGGPLLSDHDSTRQIGVHEKVWTDGHVSRAVVRFSKRQAAEDEYQDVKDGIRTGVSSGFIVHALVLEEDNDGDRLYRATDWEPIESSITSIAADITVGVGRSFDPELPQRAELIKSLLRSTSEEDPEDPDDDCECDEHDDHERCDEECNCYDGERSAETCEDTTQEEETDQNSRALSTEKKLSALSRTKPTEVRTITVDKDQELIKLGEMLGEVEMARDFIASNKTAADFKAAVLEKRQKAQIPTPQPVVEMSERELKQYSIARAILADADRRTGQGDNCFELEVSDEIQRKLDSSIKRRGGIYIPTGHKREMLQRAGLDSKTSTKGAEAIYTEYGGFIDLLRNKAKVMQLGASVFPGLTGPVSFNRQTGAGTFVWVGENPGSDVAESNLTLDVVTLSPKTGQSTTSFSRQLLIQSAFNVDATVEADLAGITALGIDLAALHGLGSSNQPPGLYVASGVNAVGFSGAAPTYPLIVSMETKVAAANADVDTMAYLATPETRGTAKTTPRSGTVAAGYIWENGEMNGYRAEVTNQLRKNLGSGTNEHGLVFGVWNQLLIGEWGAMELITDPYRLKKQGMIEVTSFSMIDIELRHAESFTKATALIP